MEWVCAIRQLGVVTTFYTVLYFCGFRMLTGCRVLMGLRVLTKLFGCLVSVPNGPACCCLVLLGGTLRMRSLVCVPGSLVFSFSLFTFWFSNTSLFVAAVPRPSPFLASIVRSNYVGYCLPTPVV